MTGSLNFPCDDVDRALVRGNIVAAPGMSLLRRSDNFEHDGELPLVAAEDMFDGSVAAAMRAVNSVLGRVGRAVRR